MKKICLAAGCFWGASAFFSKLDGVESAICGYANGQTEDPTYEQVYTDSTGFAECVMVTYDPKLISLEYLLKAFFMAINPLQADGQAHDIGTRYRSGIYDLPIINKVFNQIQSKYSKPLCTELLPLTIFYEAEEYHQNYLDKNPQGYCHLNIGKLLSDLKQKA